MGPLFLGLAVIGTKESTGVAEPKPGSYHLLPASLLNVSHSKTCLKRGEGNDETFRSTCSREPQPSPLPQQAIEKIKGRAGWSSITPLHGQFSRNIQGAIYNRNENWEITSITIKIIPKEENLKAELSQPCKADLYWCQVITESLCKGIGPSREGTFSCFEIYAPQGEFEFDWYITEVQGYKMPT